MNHQVFKYFQLFNVFTGNVSHLDIKKKNYFLKFVTNWQLLNNSLTLLILDSNFGVATSITLILQHVIRRCWSRSWAENLEN